VICSSSVIGLRLPHSWLFSLFYVGQNVLYFSILLYDSQSNQMFNVCVLFLNWSSNPFKQLSVISFKRHVDISAHCLTNQSVLHWAQWWLLTEEYPFRSQLTNCPPMFKLFSNFRLNATNEPLEHLKLKIEPWKT